MLTGRIRWILFAVFVILSRILLEPPLDHLKTISLSDKLVWVLKKLLFPCTGNKTMLEPPIFLKFKRRLTRESVKSPIVCAWKESDLQSQFTVPRTKFGLWARMESNHRPLSYQDSVLPLNYVPNFSAGSGLCSTTT